jgi:hypothetical protein
MADGDDVEGHRAKARDAEPDGLRNLGKDGPEGLRPRFPMADGDDVEGHRAKVRDAEPDGLRRGGPSTQGEIIRRGPSDNPHGER